MNGGLKDKINNSMAACDYKDMVIKTQNAVLFTVSQHNRTLLSFIKTLISKTAQRLCTLI